MLILRNSPSGLFCASSPQPFIQIPARWGNGCKWKLCVEQILSIPVLLSYTETINSGATGILPVSLLQDSKYSIWNTCYLEWLLFGILLYSTGFTKFHWFHSLPIYYRIPSVLRESINSHSTSLHVQHFPYPFMFELKTAYHYQDVSDE